MKRVKIARIIARLNIGGPAIHTILLSEGLDKAGFDTCLVAGVTDKAEGDMSYLAAQKAVKVRVVPELGRAIRPWSDLAALWKLYVIMKQEKPQIVHTHTAKAGTLGRIAAILSGAPIKVHTFHGHVFKGYFNPVPTKIFIIVERFLALFTDRFIAVSDIIKDDICAKFKIAPAEKISVIRLGLDLEKFRNSAGLKGGLRKELGVGADRILVGIVGRLTAIKNHRMFLEAIKLLRDEAGQLNVGFLIIGDGELRGNLEEMAGNLGIKDIVTFMGWRSDMSGVYADLDLVALTSLNEGTPVTLIEAMASGKAVVSTAVGGVPDLVEDKRTGWLVDSEDPAAFKDAMAALIKDEGLRRRLGEAAAAHVHGIYSSGRLIREVERLYRDMLVEKKL